MFCLPTTKDGMNSAIGQYIHDFLAAKIVREGEALKERSASPDYVPGPFIWDVKTAPKKRKTFDEYCAEIRARRA